MTTKSEYLNILQIIILVIVIVIVVVALGTLTKQMCDSASAYPNYTVTPYLDWHIGGVHINYQCSYTHGNLTIVIN